MNPTNEMMFNIITRHAKMAQDTGRFKFSGTKFARAIPCTERVRVAASRLHGVV